MRVTTKPIDEVKPNESVVLNDGRPATVRYNDAYVTLIGPSETILRHRLVTVTADGSTAYVDAPWRTLVRIVVE